MQQLYCQSSRKWYDLAPLFTRTNGVPTDRYNPNLVYNMRQSNPFWRQAISENNSGFESQKGLETVNHSVNFFDPETDGELPPKMLSTTYADTFQSSTHSKDNINQKYNNSPFKK